MCGFAGIVLSSAAPDDAAAPEEALARALGDALHHRGPDQGGHYACAGPPLHVAFATRRLAILDLSPAGDQPMQTPDGTICIAYNGELYNEPELRRDLEARGYRYRSHSDTETVLYAYQEFGAAAFARLNGMFALAIHDRRRHQVVLARDRMGIKPLYYSWDGRRLRFASELRALLRDPSLAPAVDPVALDLYLALGFVPSPHALLRGVHKLDPGTTLTLDASGRIEAQTYWAPELPPPARLGQAAAAQAVREVLSDAVARQMRSDVPVGILLSGGVDSTIIAACARAHSPQPLQTFSIRFERSGSPVQDFYNDDAAYARRVAADLGAVHHDVTCADGDVPGLLEELVTGLDEPVWELSFVSIYLMTRLARADGVKVLLTGDGSDELFAGYPWITAAARQALYEQVPLVSRVLPLVARALPRTSTLRAHAENVIGARGISDVERYERTHAIFGAADRRRLIGTTGAASADTAAGGDAGGEDALGSLLRPIAAGGQGRSRPDRMALMDLVLWVREHFNQRLDRMSMLNSVEARVPFQDNRVVDLALSLPFGTKAPLGRAKGLLRRAFQDVVPDYVLRRPKRPFAAPMWAWGAGALRTFAHDTLARDRVLAAGLVDPDACRRVLAATETAQPDRQTFQLWTLLVLQLWAERLLKPAGAPLRVPA